MTPEEKAIKIMLKLDKALQGEGDAIPRRATNLPVLIMQAGLIPALTFYLSKIDNNEKRKAFLAALRQLKGIECPSNTDSIRKDASGEGSGYAITLAIAIEALEECRPDIINNNMEGLLKNCSEVTVETGRRKTDEEVKIAEQVIRQVAAILKSLLENRAAGEAEACIQPILIEVKKLATAFYK